MRPNRLAAQPMHSTRPAIMYTNYNLSPQYHIPHSILSGQSELGRYCIIDRYSLSNVARESGNIWELSKCIIQLYSPSFTAPGGAALCNYRIGEADIAKKVSGMVHIRHINLCTLCSLRISLSVNDRILTINFVSLLEQHLGFYDWVVREKE